MISDLHGTAYNRNETKIKYFGHVKRFLSNNENIIKIKQLEHAMKDCELTEKIHEVTFHKIVTFFN